MPSLPRTFLAAVAVAVFAASAQAIPPFFVEFEGLYLDPEDSRLEEISKKERCFVCHQGKKKKNKNAYGEALAEHLTKKDKKDKEKIIAALEKVAGQSSDPEDASAPTFGELIAEGKLPGGTIEQSMEEPEQAE